MILPLRRKHPTTARSTAPANRTDAPIGEGAGLFRPRHRHAACLVALAAFVFFDSRLASAETLDGPAKVSTVQWSTPKKRASAEAAPRVAEPRSDRLKWRAPKRLSAAAKIEPRAIDEPAAAAPLATLELRAPTGQSVTEARSRPLAEVDEEPHVIMLTTGEAPIVDPFSDPFGDHEPKRAKPAELKLFPVMTTATLQSLDEVAEETADAGAPGALDAPDESLLEEMRVEQAPQEKMPDDELRREDVGGLELPSDQELAQNPAIQTEKCPAPRDLKPINEITNQIAAEPGIFPQECTLGDEPFKPRNFAPATFTWKASALCHKPLYFEQVGVERYGHTWGPFLQPVVGSAHFFGSVIMLPYKMGVEPPWECIYPLGYYRPGSCAPYTVGPVPISLRGVMAQAGATLGFVYIFAP